jgi:hypothetical protein
MEFVPGTRDCKQRMYRGLYCSLPADISAHGLGINRAARYGKGGVLQWLSAYRPGNRRRCVPVELTFSVTLGVF